MAVDARRHHGVALKRRHFADILERGPRADWFEIVSENFFSAGGRPWSVLERIRTERPVSLHGTALGLGNPEGVSEVYLDRLSALVARILPERVSDHLCFVGSDGEYSHELLPLPRTSETVAHVVEQIDRVQTRLERMILVENPSTYFGYVEDAMSAAELLAEVAARSGCGILLDLDNVVVDAHNHGFEPRAFVDALPARQVEEYHLAGFTPDGSLLVDTHVGPVPEAVWSLYRHALRTIGPRPTLVEWDTDTPDLDTVLLECERARSIEREEEARR